MMRLAAVALGILGGVMAWQNHRYLRARRNLVQDRQPILHRSVRFHVVTFLEVAEGQDVVEQVRMLRRAIEASGSAQVVYAGQAAFTVPSSQLEPGSWDAVVVVQYESREAYETAAVSTVYREALMAFRRSYSHGMRRSSALNLLIPQALLGLRLIDLLQGKWDVGELDRAALAERSEKTAGAGERVEALRSLAAVNDEAAVVVNLIRNGDRAQRASDRAYGRRMATRFAARRPT